MLMSRYNTNTLLVQTHLQEIAIAKVEADKSASVVS
jgi:hypothetical protein